MGCDDITKRESEDPTLIIQDLIRNGLLSVHKTLMDAQHSIEQTEHRINAMMQGLQLIIDKARECNATQSKTGRDQSEN
jgi:hypothetical protein